MEGRIGIKVAVLALLGVVLALLSACGGGVSQEDYDAVKQQLAALQQQQEGKADLAAINKLVQEKFTTYDKELPLWAIQPGTATQMRQLAESFNLMWFAAQAGNWEFAAFEVYRAGEQVKPILVTRPGRTEAINEWLPILKALEEAVGAKGKARFETAYDKAINGCNACHAESKGGGFEIGPILITRPTTPLYSNVDYKGP